MNKKNILVINLIIFASCQRGVNTENLIKIYSARHGIDYKLAISQIKTECNFKSDAIGKAGEIGLGQVIYKYHKKRCNLKNKNQLFNRSINLNCSFKILNYFILKCDGIRKGLACYNAGYEGMRKGRGFKYADKILKMSKKNY